MIIGGELAKMDLPRLNIRKSWGIEQTKLGILPSHLEVEVACLDGKTKWSIVPTLVAKS